MIVLKEYGKLLLLCIFSSSFSQFYSILIYTTLVNPFRIAFYDEDPITWIVIDSIVDIIFTIDIILNFFTSYVDKDENLITDKPTIAKTYIRGWFIIDVVSVFPISLLLQSQRDYTTLGKEKHYANFSSACKIAKALQIAEND
jgi:hypothetical protein